MLQLSTLSLLGLGPREERVDSVENVNHVRTLFFHLPSRMMLSLVISSGTP